MREATKLLEAYNRISNTDSLDEAVNLAAQTEKVKAALKKAATKKNFVKVAAIFLAIGVPVSVVRKILKKKKAEDALNQLTEDLDSIQEAIHFVEEMSTRFDNKFKLDKEAIKAQMEAGVYDAATAIKEAERAGVSTGVAAGIVQWFLIQVWLIAALGVAAIIAAMIIRMANK